MVHHSDSAVHPLLAVALAAKGITVLAAIPPPSAGYALHVVVALHETGIPTAAADTLAHGIATMGHMQISVTSVRNELYAMGNGRSVVIFYRIALQ